MAGTDPFAPQLTVLRGNPTDTEVEAVRAALADLARADAQSRTAPADRWGSYTPQGPARQRHRAAAYSPRAFSLITYR
ncbi:acyl-CoA carboxylase epsilon subunit [Corynebacterium uberis]|uniref:acyl-CoA carboxylase epsilon subunit n=1 Tax=Corynebacterium TaxID=1716 RepID=UPI001D0BC842|nr:MULTISPECIES: acyl-CoA carboxylase epsilon subunit [Corynebacterium]MCZ9309253.1 acyl-CoA carboxylase subunit epsilon [Corynebacterium sp. c6VSa_13]UDL72808.1 acyl-CoA carboxylase subunit epsilon [Corynebacterium uberis]UDL76315.1 acyl-CoA carboxylase subunit epsilon [Corynebacterium uberis]UDL78527.1 acyl-CoA carboxylase subunit epsilon [Corynebacterium uberis]UDL80808.1 acyl-CoA carboxylase subunit epsilon [Corynebacterium uberis]